MSVRKHSSWRKGAYAQLVAISGACCAICGEDERRIWRVAGRWNNDDWGCDEDGRAVSTFTRVNGSSNLEVDHKLPLRDGGTNELANLWLLCRDCHKSKTATEHSARLRGLFAEARP